VELSIPFDALACPYCLGSLELIGKGVFCASCNTIYPNTEIGQLDLRLRRNKEVAVSFLLTSSSSLIDNRVFHILHSHEDIHCDLKLSNDTTEELTTYIPKARSNSSLMLDLGCGDVSYKSSFIHAGYKYVGLDYSSKVSELLGDAHALPFKDETFEFIFSRAVLEHLRYPFLALDEAYRVLKPGCRFIGTVAFLEPFHGRSFYHHTHLGLLNGLEHAGFQVEHISPNPKWSVLYAQAQMSLFPKMPSALSRAVVFPLQKMHEAWWKIGRSFNPEATELTRLLSTTGSLIFIASKANC
jgi:SAM-dependent methyltransferase